MDCLSQGSEPKCFFEIKEDCQNLQMQNISLMLLWHDNDCCKLLYKVITVLPELELLVYFLTNKRWTPQHGSSCCLQWFHMCSFLLSFLSLLMERCQTPKTLSVWWRGIQAPTGKNTNKLQIPIVIIHPPCLLMCSRCFSFGIGEGASSALINGLAREGGGHAQFVAGTDRMQPKVRHS